MATVTFKGTVLNLVGKEPILGDPIPDIELTDGDMQPFKTSSLKGKTTIIATVPCLATSVCDTMTRRFNQEASKLNSDINIITVSMDLPFTLKNWCGAAGISNIKVLSDHKEALLGKSLGILIKEWRMLARSVFIIDAKGSIKHIHIVNEIADQPDYSKILEEVKQLSSQKLLAR
jgi:thiol peroxidase